MGGAFFASLHVGATPGAPRSVLERAPLVADVRCRDGLPAPGEDVAVEDFLIPSLVRDFQDWNAPTVADGAAELLDLAGVSGTFDDKAAWISELFDDLLETLEPTQILLALTDHHVERIVVAASTGDLFPSLVLDRDMKLTALTRAGLPAPVTDALTSPTTVVALQLATRFDLTMPLADVHDGWLTIALDDGGGALDLDDVRDRLVRAVDGVHAALLDDIRDAVGETPLGELRDHPTIQSGLLTLYDPATWSFASVSDPDRDALDEADADALAVFALAEEVLIQVSAGDLDGFLREEVGRNLWGVVPCRSRFDDTRDERHLMRRGLRGARRRNRKLGVDGHRRDFRVGQARVLTYTEMILALHIQGVADILHPPAAPPGDGGTDPGTGEPGTEDPGTGDPAGPEPETGTLSFQVHDDLGQPVEGARIVLYDLENNARTEGLTDAGGGASVEGPPAEYTAQVSYDYHNDAWLAVEITDGVTTPVDVELDRDVIRCIVRCLKICTYKELTHRYTTLHSCRVYLFEENDGAFTWTGHAPEVKSSGEIDYDFLRSKPYAMYFAGRELSHEEIGRLQTDRSYVLIRTSVTTSGLDIDSSFFWWIALLQYVEANIVPTTGDPAAEVLTCVRELYYDDLNWTFLINRGSIPRLIQYSSITGAYTVRNGMDLTPIMALGRTYALDDTPGYFVMETDWGWRGPSRERKVEDRHEYVILPLGEELHIGHALAGVEAFLFPPSPIGSLVFGYPRSAATWAGDLGQACYAAFDALRGDWWWWQYDGLAQDHPGDVATAWNDAATTFGRKVEMIGDVHGIALGRRYVLGEAGMGARLPAGRPLSELLEEYFLSPGRGSRAVGLFVSAYEGYGLTRDMVRNGQMPMIGGLRDETNSFAETWDDTLNPLQRNWVGSSPTNQALITDALQHLNGILGDMDP